LVRLDQGKYIFEQDLLINVVLSLSQIRYYVKAADKSCH